MSVSTTIHDIASITMDICPLRGTGSMNKNKNWTAQTIRFYDSEGNTVHEITVHGMENESGMEIEMVGD